MAEHGLSARHLHIIGDVLCPFADQIELVGLFGSRALGRARGNSDVDIVLYGEIDSGKLGAIHDGFEESDLPFKVDVVLYSRLDYLPFRQHVETVMRPLFTQDELKRIASARASSLS